MENARLRKGSRVTRKRQVVDLDYDSANALLSALIRRIYARAHTIHTAGNFQAVETEQQRLNNIHQEMVNLITSFQGQQIPLNVLLGGASAVQAPILATIFETDDAATRTAYFRAELGPELYDRLMRNADQLKVEFGRFSNQLAIFLRNIDATGKDDDFIEYHISVGPQRIYEGKLSPYHFSNHFYPPAAAGAGGAAAGGQLGDRWTFYKNDGTPYRGRRNAERNAIRAMHQREPSDEEANLYSRAFAFMRHLNAPTANSRAEIGPARLATEAEAGAGAKVVATSGGRKSAAEEARISAEKEAENMRVLNAAIAESHAASAAAAAAVAPQPAVAAAIEAVEEAPIPSSNTGAKLDAILRNSRLMGLTVSAQRSAFDAMVESFFQDLSTLERSRLLPEDKKLIHFIITSDLFPNKDQARNIVRAVVYDRFQLERIEREFAETRTTNKLKAFANATKAIKNMQKTEEGKNIFKSATRSAARDYYDPAYPELVKIMHKIFDIRFGSGFGVKHVYPPGLWQSLVEQVIVMPKNHHLYNTLKSYLLGKESMMQEFILAVQSLERTAVRLKQTGTERYKRLKEIITDFGGGMKIQATKFRRGGRRKTRRRLT